MVPIEAPLVVAQVTRRRVPSSARIRLPTMAVGVAVARRIVLMALVLAAATFVSFVFFWHTDVPLHGKPAVPAYWHWVKGLFTGSSYRGLFSGAPLWQTQFRQAIGHTTALLLVATVFVAPVSVLMTWVAARRRDGAADLTLRALTYLAWAVPAFLVSMLIALAATQLGSGQGLGPFPVAGWPGVCIPGFGLDSGTFLGCPGAGTGATLVWNVFRYLFFPGIALSLAFLGLHARHLRAAVLETLDAPFVTTARSKGLSEIRILVRHVMRMSLASFVNGLLADVGAIFGAALAVDVVFRLNGLGTLLISDFPINGPSSIDVYSVNLLLLITGAFVLLSAVVADTVTAALDPRLRADA
jgi:peptide/nickel transport system permease protein